MTGQAERTAGLVLELNRARRQLATIRALCERAEQGIAHGLVDVQVVLEILDHPPAPPAESPPNDPDDPTPGHPRVTR